MMENNFFFYQEVLHNKTQVEKRRMFLLYLYCNRFDITLQKPYSRKSQVPHPKGKKMN